MIKILCDDRIFMTDNDKFRKNFNNLPNNVENTENTIILDADPLSVKFWVDYSRGYISDCKEYNQNRIIIDSIKYGFKYTQSGSGKEVEYNKEQLQSVFKELGIKSTGNNLDDLNNPKIESAIRKYNENYNQNSTTTDHPYNKISEELKKDSYNTETSPDNVYSAIGGYDTITSSDYVSEYKKIK